MENIIDNLESKCTTAANKNNNKNNRELDIEVVHPSCASQGHHGNTSVQLLTT